MENEVYEFWWAFFVEEISAGDLGGEGVPHVITYFEDFLTGSEEGSEFSTTDFSWLFSDFGDTLIIRKGGTRCEWLIRYAKRLNSFLKRKYQILGAKIGKVEKKKKKRKRSGEKRNYEILLLFCILGRKKIHGTFPRSYNPVKHFRTMYICD